jgi:hypothetical protein
MTERRLDSRDVLDPNARTKSAFTGRVIGHYRPSGPNSWDDYEYVELDGGPLEVMAGLTVQAEPDAAVVRLRRHGEVLAVEWCPTSADLSQIERSQVAVRDYFVAHHLEDYSSPPAWGLAAVVQKKLKEDDRDMG